MHTTRYTLFPDGAIATVTTRVARQGITVITETPLPVRAGADQDKVIPHDSLSMVAENIVDRLVEAREALMRCGWAASCATPNTLTVCIPGGTFPRVATIYGDPSGLSISGQKAEALARILDAEGVKVLVN